MKKTISLDELKNLPPLSADEIEEVMNFKNTDFSDCPKQSKEDLAAFKPLKELKPEIYAMLDSGIYKPTKKEIHIRIDSDVLEWFKSQGKGYQTRINEALRQAMLSASL